MPSIHSFQIVAVRMFITYFGATSWMLFRKIPDPFFGPPPVRGLLFARGITGFFGLFAVYYSLGYMTSVSFQNSALLLTAF